MTDPVLIAPSLLSADFSRLEEDIEKARQMGARALFSEKYDERVRVEPGKPQTRPWEAPDAGPEPEQPPGRAPARRGRDRE